jgi:hypothetical protein
MTFGAIPLLNPGISTVPLSRAYSLSKYAVTCSGDTAIEILTLFFDIAFLIDFTLSSST